MALDHSSLRLGLENIFLINKSGRIFCVRQAYFTKSCQQIWGCAKPIFYTFYTSPLRWNSTTVFIIRTSDRMQYFTIFQDKLHSVNIQDDQSILLIREYLNLTQEVENCFVLQKTDVATVYLLLSKISQSKATGLDLISVRLLREYVDLIAPSLSVSSLITVLSLEFFLMIGNVPKLFFFSNKANAMT